MRSNNCSHQQTLWPHQSIFECVYVFILDIFNRQLWNSYWKLFHFPITQQTGHDKGFCFKCVYGISKNWWPQMCGKVLHTFSIIDPSIYRLSSQHRDEIVLDESHFLHEILHWASAWTFVWRVWWPVWLHSEWVYTYNN